MGEEGRRFKRIGEVSKVTGVAPSVLRFWEKEFPQLSPLKKRGQRLYRHEDISLILRIKDLVHEKGFTLDGARKELNRARERRGLAQDIVQGLEEIKRELILISELLKGK